MKFTDDELAAMLNRMQEYTTEIALWLEEVAKPEREGVVDVVAQVSLTKELQHATTAQKKLYEEYTQRIIWRLHEA